MSNSMSFHFKYFTPLLIIIALTLTFCQKGEKSNFPPKIEFIKDSGYVYTDTTISLGTIVKVGIHSFKSTENITYFNVKMDNGVILTALDSGLNNSSMNYCRSILKSNSQYEIWTFSVMDKDRNKSGISIKLTKKPAISYGDIIFFPSVILGAQNNTNAGHFYSLSNNIIYNQQDAFNNQQLIDLIYYYGLYESTLSSPNEAEVPLFYTGITGIAGWTIKNETRYDTTSVTVPEFDSSANDSLLLTEYDQINGKKKAKYLQPGMIVSFRNQTGKIGLLKVNSVNETDSGSIDISIKVQK
jgi:hypothetical protein